MASSSDFCEGQDGFPCDATGIDIMSLSIAAGGAALLFAVVLVLKLKKHPRGSTYMNAISDRIRSGAISFLRIEYTYLLAFALIVFALLLILYTVDPPSGVKTDGIRYAGSFLAGAFLSAAAGWAGLLVSTNANVRTTQAADQYGLAAALRTAYTGGAVMGLCVVGFGLVGLSVMFLLVNLGYDDADTVTRLIYAGETLSGFGFGASSIALFARVAGGIYTKAADVGADLVGKIELEIPEDDPRNPAVIADNVGDNVGDVAGMGADLFESFVGSIIAALTLADGDITLVMLPFWIAGAGAVASIIGYFAVHTFEGASQRQLLFALQKGVAVSAIFVLAFSAIIVHFLFDGREEQGWRTYGCIVVGLVAGILIGQITEFFTSYSYYPTRSIADAGVTGPATVIIQGLGVGMISCVVPVLIIVGTILICDALAGEYGVATSAVGMLSTIGINLAADCYGAISDNAGGIAEMAGLDKKVRDITDQLDALGNTAAATGKGFAIGSAVLTALSLLTAFKEKAKVDVVDIADPIVLSGVLIGAMLPFLFSAFTMLSVQKAAHAIMIEVIHQFDEIPGLREGTAEPDSDRCVAISTRNAVHEMILPGLYAVLSPMAVGFLVGPSCLTGMLGGSISSGMMLAIMMANSGGAWDNSKKYVEIEGAHGGKRTPVHVACVIGDTVGDPFKDTSGPSLNILIKLMSIVSLTLAPVMAGTGDWPSTWYIGLVPIFLLVVGTYFAYYFFWKNIETMPSRGLSQDTTNMNGDKASRNSLTSLNDSSCERVDEEQPRERPQDDIPDDSMAVE